MCNPNTFVAPMSGLALSIACTMVLGARDGLAAIHTAIDLHRLAAWQRIDALFCDRDDAVDRYLAAFARHEYADDALRDAAQATSILME